jgi:ADP-heptose:LPS heptosyltransferase
VVAGLDLVISVDTSAAHLAGALGRPVWLLNRASSEWRWGWKADRSPWYPTMAMFNQEALLDWAPVMAAVQARLADSLAIQAT